VGFAVGLADGFALGLAVVGSRVGTELGEKLGRRVVGTGVGETDGAVGSVVGTCVVGAKVGAEEGTGVALKVGAAVGEYVTRDTPLPAMATSPVHVVEPMQPSRMMYVCDCVYAGTVYCTCAHTLVPEMHAAGGLSPLPVSSYTTSTPAAE
jgi:hypothetical protein